MKNIPDKVNLMNVYLNGRKLIGVSGEITLADYEQMSETLAAAGVLGEIEIPTIGQFSANQMELPFVSMCEDLYELIAAGESMLVTLRASQQSIDGNGNIVPLGLSITYGGFFKSMTGGTLKQGAGTGSSVTMELTYTKISYDGTDVFELDKLNGVYKVSGKDVMSKYKELA